MNRLRAVLRRLDPWAALVLGGLLAMGVVILLATPGPWQSVVGNEVPPVNLEAPAPDDVAIFVMAGRAATCSGVIWLHVDAERRALTAVVVAPRTSCFSPTDGFAPVADVVNGAGPGIAAEALGDALGVSMDAWVTLDRKATELAVQAMVPPSDVKATRLRYRAARAAWRGRGEARDMWLQQYETLRLALPQVPFEELGVVAFANYVLGFGFVRSDLTLQGATSLGRALRDVDRNRVEVRAAPVVVERSRGGEVWRADASRVEPLRHSLVIGIRPPETERLVSVRERAARVLVVAPYGRREAELYAARVSRSLGRAAGAAVPVTLVRGSDLRLAFRVARELDRRPALAVLVAPSQEEHLPAVRKVLTLLRNRGQEAVVSGPLPEPPGMARDGVAAVADAVAASGLPVSWPAWATTASAGTTGARLGDDALIEAAGRNVQTLVRACWPQALAPDLRSTVLGFAFVEARNTGVAVIGPEGPAADLLLTRLRLWGFPAVRVALEEGGWRPPAPGPLVAYRPGARTAAAALAGDLGLPRRSVVRVDDTPRKLVVVLPDDPVRGEGASPEE